METNDRFEFYSDNRDKWRWRRYSSNGRIVGASSQGYASKQACIENAKRNGYKGN
ncbi:YegP family protein [Parabacteroides goldsteinii]|uniref:YegP family protein n=1 Tax=Parabacteroides goldsteinii TaxID=328812 RepID=UPI003AB6CF3A